MQIAIIRRQLLRAAGGIALCLGLTAAPAAATPVITRVDTDLALRPYTFSFLGGSFTFTGNGGFPNYLAVSTAGGAAVRTVFGTPSTDFTDRGTVIYDANTLGGYAPFASLTTIPYSNGDNFLGLRVTSGGQNYYGYLFTTNSRLNTYAFETVAETGIIATTAIPEPAAWAMMVVGVGATGAGLRRRRAKVAVSSAESGAAGGAVIGWTALS